MMWVWKFFSFFVRMGIGVSIVIVFVRIVNVIFISMFLVRMVVYFRGY